MKKQLFLAILMIVSLDICGQSVKESNTKMDVFASKTGVIIKFVDFSLPNLNLTYGAAETKVRKLISGGDVGYFYQVSYKGQYDTKTASIAYEDLLEVIKALQTLRTELTADQSSNPDYLENKFVTEDGFQLGYYVSSGKVKWYLVLEKYGSGNTIFINDVLTIETALNGAKSKIESLKNL